MIKFSSIDIFWILLFLYYSFGVEKTNTFIRSRGSLVNHTRFKTIMVKIYTRFQTKTAQKPYPLGRHIPIAYIGECPPPPGSFTALDVYRKPPSVVVDRGNLEPLWLYLKHRIYERQPGDSRSKKKTKTPNQESKLHKRRLFVA